MQDAHAFLANLATVLCAAALTTILSQRLRLPVVFGYLVAGLIVGPHIPIPLVADLETVRTLSELGVILLMYSLGLEFSLKRVVRIGGTSGLAALAETSLMFGLGYSAANLMGWTGSEAIFTGAVVAISSTTIIAKVFAEMQVQGRLREIVFGILVVEDLIAILLIAVLSAVAAGVDVSATALAVTGVRLATFLAALIAAGLLVLPRLMRYIVSLDRAETTVVAGIGICFAAALLALSFGYSVALGAFIAGSLVSESGHGERLEHLIAPVRDVFVAIFFVAVGMLIDPRALLDNWTAILALTLVVIAGKFLSVSIGVFLTGEGLRHSVRAGMSLAQIGEFSFIIAGIGLTSGATRPFLYPVAIAVSAITTLTTPWLAKRADEVAKRVDSALPPTLQTFTALYGSWIERMRQAHPDEESRRVRGLVRLVLLEVLALAAIAIAAVVEVGRGAILLRSWLGLSESASRWALFGVAVLVSAPFVIGLFRQTRALASELAFRALPRGDVRGLDRAAAPRRALMTTLQFGMLLSATVPFLAVLQPLVPRLPTFGVLAVVVLLLGIAVWQSAGDLYGHARAGAEVIGLALAQHDRARGTTEELTQAMRRVSEMLPGLGDPEPVRIDRRSTAVGISLGDLDLRGATGATVLTIARLDPDGTVRNITPSAHETLQEGDVLALAGTHDDVAAARARLGDAPSGEGESVPPSPGEPQRLPHLPDAARRDAGP